jgi:hypothetical protein
MDRLGGAGLGRREVVGKSERGCEEEEVVREVGKKRGIKVRVPEMGESGLTICVGAENVKRRGLEGTSLDSSRGDNGM